MAQYKDHFDHFKDLKDLKDLKTSNLSNSGHYDLLWAVLNRHNTGIIALLYTSVRTTLLSLHSTVRTEAIEIHQRFRERNTLWEIRTSLPIYCARGEYYFRCTAWGPPDIEGKICTVQYHKLNLKKKARKKISSNSKNTVRKTDGQTNKQTEKLKTDRQTQ